MLRRAARAELFLMARDRGPSFWGFCFVPCFYVAFAGAFSLAPIGRLGPIEMTIDPVLESARAAAMGGNPLVHLFAAIGIAAIFAREYRYATWRLIGPRAPRNVLFGGKWLACVAALGAMLAAVTAGSAVLSLVQLLANDAATLRIATSAASAACLFLASLLELAAFATTVALLAIATRSSLGAILPAFLFSSVQALAQAYAPPPATAGPWLLLPGYAGELARRWALPVSGLPPVADHAGLVAFAALIFWCAAGAAAALWLLQRQDWSRE